MMNTLLGRVFSFASGFWKIFAAIFLIACVASGCAPAFNVEKSDTRFTENDSIIFNSSGNRISTKSIAGGVHVNTNGVYLNPFVEKDPDAGTVRALGLQIINKTDYDTTFGAANQLGMIREVAFRTGGADGELMVLDVVGQDVQTSDVIYYNRVSVSASYDKWETGVVRISPQELERIALADDLSAKITGTARSVVYEEGEISPEFQANLERFYREYVQ